MKKIAVFYAAAFLALLFPLQTLAADYTRTPDAAVYADFNGQDTELAVGVIPGDTVTYLNGIGDDTSASLTGGALKIELGPSGFVVLGQDRVKIRDDTGNVSYNYMVIRIRGENGNENRSESGGILMFIGGGDGSHGITLNDRATGTAPCAVDASGNPMNAISTEWQEFAIALTSENVRDQAGCTGLNINNVSGNVTLYIDDIYFTNTYPETAAVYNPETSTQNISQNSEESSSANETETGESGTGESGADDTSASAEETASDVSVERLDPPPAVSRSSGSSENGGGTAALIASGSMTAVLTAVFVVIYIKVIRKIK